METNKIHDIVKEIVVKNYGPTLKKIGRNITLKLYRVWKDAGLQWEEARQKTRDVEVAEMLAAGYAENLLNIGLQHFDWSGEEYISNCAFEITKERGKK